MNAWDLGKKRTKPRESELEVEKPGVYTKRENSAVAASKEFILALVCTEKKENFDLVGKKMHLRPQFFCVY